MPIVTNNHKRKLQEGRIKSAKVKRTIQEGMMVKVTKAPKETPYLKDKAGIVVNTHGMACVKIGDYFTHFRYTDIELMKKGSN